jgi:hypothetical protein
MDRDMDEMLVSQEKMLERLNRESAPRDQIKRAFTVHLARLFEWLSKQPHIRVLRVNYNDLLADPEPQVERVNAFLGGRMDTVQMARSVDPSLYRNRKDASVGAVEAGDPQATRAGKDI